MGKRTKTTITDSERARALGATKSPLKAATSAQNGARRLARPLTDFRCECGACPDTYQPGEAGGKTTCPRGLVIYTRNRRLHAKT